MNVAIAAPADKHETMRTLRSCSMWLLLVVLAWEPFPLGGAVAWAPALQEIVIALCWALFALSLLGRPMGAAVRPVVLVPLLFMAAVLGWAYLQTLPILPQTWTHPIWAAAGRAMGQPVQAAVSLNPWRTEAEFLKLASYVLAGCLAYFLALKPERAAKLLNGVIAVISGYAVYAFVLALAGIDQTGILYAVPHQTSFVSGPFMLHNSFATFCGLGALAATAKLVVALHKQVEREPLAWRSIELLRRLLKPNLWFLLAAVVCLCGVLVSGSRAGFAATLCGLFAVVLVSLAISRTRGARFALVGVLAAGLLLLGIWFCAGENTLSVRFSDLLNAGTSDEIRLALWGAGRRMVADFPWRGLGLGTFQDAYPLYETQVIPFVMDKAHCDYLEFAAGLGIPAAFLWWLALVWLAALCLRGVFVRRRGRSYPLIGFGACVIVGLHSTVDFSLQLPAIALVFSVLLGVGAAQATATPQLAMRSLGESG